MSGAQPMSEASALAVANVLGIAILIPFFYRLRRRACPMSGAQPMSEASALAVANVLSIAILSQIFLSIEEKSLPHERSECFG